MRLAFAGAAVIFLIASLWLATVNRATNRYARYRFNERQLILWAVVYLLLAMTAGLLAWRWPFLFPPG